MGVYWNLELDEAESHLKTVIQLTSMRTIGRPRGRLLSSAAAY